MGGLGGYFRWFLVIMVFSFCLRMIKCFSLSSIMMRFHWF